MEIFLGFLWKYYWKCFNNERSIVERYNRNAQQHLQNVSLPCGGGSFFFTFRSRNSLAELGKFSSPFFLIYLMLIKLLAYSLFIILILGIRISQQKNVYEFNRVWRNFFKLQSVRSYAFKQMRQFKRFYWKWLSPVIEFYLKWKSFSIKIVKGVFKLTFAFVSGTVIIYAIVMRHILKHVAH